jgi:hypothetical protein
MHDLLVYMTAGAVYAKSATRRTDDVPAASQGQAVTDRSYIHTYIPELYGHAARARPLRLPLSP